VTGHPGLLRVRGALTADRVRTAGMPTLVLVLVALLGAMAAGSDLARPPATTPAAQTQTAQTLTAPAPAGAAAYTVARPGPLRGALQRPALLVVAEAGTAREARTRVVRRPGVAAAEPVGIGSLVMTGRSVTALSVRPASYRRFSSEETAEMDAVWDAVARGELAVTHDMAQGLQLPLGGEAQVGPQERVAAVRVGAIATTVPAVDVVVNRPRGAQLGLPTDNALVVSVEDDAEPSAVREGLAALLGRRFTVSDLAPRATSPGGVYAARLVGGSVASAVGSFRYRWFADGSVAPDPAWVSANIRTEPVPILGSVTCHRVMLPQLRGALQEVLDAGLASSIDAADYGGCYVPRFIGRDPSRGLSLHTWGIAVDLNVATNQLGTPGAVDRRVVAILGRWGFSWGGAWRVPDPMHFELAALRR
jgi:hypothetical protein